MKLKQLFWTIALFLLVLPFANAGQPDNRSGLILYYQFNNDSSLGENDSLILDHSVRLNTERAGEVHHNASVNSGVLIKSIYNTTKKLLGNNDICFAGDANDELLIPDGEYHTFTDDFTFCYWINPVVGTGDRTFLTTGTDWDGANDITSYVASSDVIVFDGKAGATKVLALAGVTTIGTGTWKFVCGRRNATHGTLFINALEDKTDATASGTLGNNADNLMLGDDPAGAFDGCVAEVQIWNRSLEKREISNLYNGGLGEEITGAAAPGIIINDTSPTISVSHPSEGSAIDNSTLYPFKINGTVTIQNGTIGNITINSTSWKNIGNNTIFNFTFNGTYADQIWNLNLTANSTNGNKTSFLLSFIFDLTLPTVDKTTLSSNHTLHYAHQNVTFQINFSDNNKLFSFNVTTPEGFLFNITGINTTYYIFNGSFNASDYGIGLHTLTTEFCDAHTRKLTTNWNYTKDANKLMRFDNGLIIGPYNSLEWDSISVEKKTDKNIFRYISKTELRGDTRRFIVEGKREVFIYGDDGLYKAWLVVDGNKWVDHNLKNQPFAKYEIIRESKKRVIIVISEIYGNELEFESAGDLNCAKKTYNYYLFNYTAFFTSPVIETTKSEFKLQIDFKDIRLKSNGSLIYNNIAYNTTNISTINSINLTLNFTTPQVPGNITNITFYWDFKLNESSFTTTNFTQVVNRVQLTLCGELTNVNTLNISIFNEEIPSDYIKADIDAVFTIWTNDSGNTLNFTFDLNGATNYTLCIFPNTTLNANTYLFHNTSGGFRERWFLTNAKLTTNVSLLYLYNFITTTGISELRGTLRDTSFDFFSLVITKMQRYYPIEDLWRTVQMDRSDDFGQILFNIKEKTTDYRLVFEKDGSKIDDTNSMKFICTSSICTLTFIVEKKLAATNPVLSLHYAYNNETQMFQLNFSDTTGLTHSVRLVLTHERGDKSTTICDTTSTSTTGTINCNTSGYTGNLFARIYKSQSHEIPALIINIFKATGNAFFQNIMLGSREAGFWAIGISSTFITGGSIVAGPIGAIIAYVFSLIFINMLTLLNFGTTAFITLIAVMGITISLIIKKT